MHIIFSIVICILWILFFSYIAKKTKIPNVVGLIIGGVILGLPKISNCILGENTSFILKLGDVGLVVLMFLAGLEISWSMLYKERKDAFYVSIFSFFIPFILGTVAFLLLGFQFRTALIVGICMSITAEATKARVLMELKKLKSKVGSLMMGAGIIDDILGMISFGLVLYFFTKTIITKEFMTLFCSIVAFFIGILIHKFIGREKKKIRYLEKFMLLFIVPFFFISMGLHFNMRSLILNSYLLVIVVVMAFLGKMIGPIATKPITRLKFKQLYLIGWGMNSRGAVELALTFIAFKTGLINVTLYSCLVVMALITTLCFPFFIRRMVKKDPKILD